MIDNATIFARATAPGKAGVAVIRISGEGVLRACRHFGYGVNDTASPAPRKAILHRFKVSGEFIDSGLLLYFKAPHSFTGEDIVEFQLHGGNAIQQRMLAELAGLEGFRLAQPGEFSQRAFFNQKMDLAEAEGLVDLINAETERQREFAARLTQGQASRFYGELRQSILQPMALLEAYIDFPDEEIPESVWQQLQQDIDAVCESIRYQLRASQSAERLRQGYEVLLIGAPNSGKSSLLNRIAGREVAIVTPVAGTTRDLLEVACDINGLPVTFVDSAGLRETDELVEAEGIRRTRDRMQQADLILLLSESGAFPEWEESPSSCPTLFIQSKADLLAGRADSQQQGDSAENTNISISSKTGQGVDNLLAKVSSVLEEMLPPADSFASHQRHRLLLDEALMALESSGSEALPEIKAEKLRQAACSLAEIIGSYSVEDVLEIIFSTFCIGK